jgi:ribosomal protein S18 acetylase RimI-like enzyme
MDDLAIRLADDSDLDEVTSLLRACIGFMLSEGIDQWDDVYPSRTTVVNDIREKTLYLASRAGPPAAAMVMNETQDDAWNAAHWSIDDVRVLVVHRLMVHPQHQGKGVAQQMMGFAERWGQAHGYGAIRLDAFSENPRALRLYERLGYRDAGGATFRKGAFRCFEKRIAMDGC